jgi:hypothetical protein
MGGQIAWVGIRGAAAARGAAGCAARGCSGAAILLLLITAITVGMAISLLQLIASTNLLCSVRSLLVDRVMVHMGEDEEMSYCLYFKSTCL